MAKHSSETLDRYHKVNDLVKAGKLTRDAIKQVGMSTTHFYKMKKGLGKTKRFASKPKVVDLPQVETKGSKAAALFVGSPHELLEIMRGLL